jgi:DNA-binding PadR family transcriptional regulator
MMNSYYGQNTLRLLKRLENKGFVRSDIHMDEEGRHWQLTPAGLEEAERALANLGRS